MRSVVRAVTAAVTVALSPARAAMASAIARDESDLASIRADLVALRALLGEALDRGVSVEKVERIREHIREMEDREDFALWSLENERRRCSPRVAERFYAQKFTVGGPKR